VPQLLTGAFDGTGFVEDNATGRGDLITADDYRARVAHRDGFRLGNGQAQRPFGGGFAGHVRLVDFGGLYGKGQAQAVEQLAAKGGDGGQNQGWLGAQITPLAGSKTDCGNKGLRLIKWF
jgi:hypothetical protein